MATRLDGPRLPARSGQAKQLVVILHGFGADGQDLISLGQQWSQILPDAAFVAPNAHEPCEHMPSGRQWFRLTDRNPHEHWSGACAAAPILDGFIDEELARHSLPGSQVALVGFSQGACLTSETVLRNPRPYGFVGVLSGGAIGPPGTPRDYQGTLAGATVFLGCSDHDPHIPLARVKETTAVFTRMGATVTERIYPGSSHGINDDEITYLRAGLAALAK